MIKSRYTSKGSYGELLQKIANSINLDLNSAALYIDGGTGHDKPYTQLVPEDFLYFAEKDLSQKDQRGLVNAISNVKRSIDCQTELIIKHLSVPVKLMKLSKLEALQDVGILAPLIVKKIRELRHRLEHEYKIPKRSEVEDAIGVANLFLHSSNPIFGYLPEDIGLYDPKTSIHGNSGLLYTPAIGIASYSYIATKKDTHFEIGGHREGQERTPRFCIPKNSLAGVATLRLFISAFFEKNENEALAKWFLALASAE